MAKFRDATEANISAILRRFADWLDRESDEDTRIDVAHASTVMLDALLEADAFGTEGQHDPRGDHRG